MAANAPADETQALEDFNAIETLAKKFISNELNDKAVQLYSRFIEDGTADVKYLALARNNRGHLRYKTVDFKGAIEDYTVAIQLDPCLAVSYYNRGQIHYRMGRFEQAIADLEKTLALEPDFIDAQENLRQAKADIASKY